MAAAHRSKPRRARAMLWSAVIILVASMVLPLSGYVYVALVSPSQAASAKSYTNPRANYWRAVREGDQGYVAASGPYTTNVLVQNGGQNWREVRNGPVASYGAGIILAAIIILLVFYAIRGSMRIEAGRSGRTVARWNALERLMHWYVAILFIVLAITGLSMLFGRAILVPWLGLEGFAAWAKVSITLHNFLGPLFIIGVVAMILFWIKNNIPASYDWQWFKSGGGAIKGKHAPAGKANAGEKLLVFWIGVFICGIIVSASGVILDFPLWGQTRGDMQLAQVLHSSFALIWITIALGHMYLGTIGIEGAFEGMVSGRVDVNWAEQHNSVWFDKVKDTAEASDTPKTAAGAAGQEAG
ncbi:MAG: formate dehydrogenase subunit gamma [Arenicellales bacterium]